MLFALRITTGYRFGLNCKWALTKKARTSPLCGSTADAPDWLLHVFRTQSNAWSGQASPRGKRQDPDIPCMTTALINGLCCQSMHS